MTRVTDLLSLPALSAVLAGAVAGPASPEPLSADRSLTDLGINSLELLNIMMTVAAEHDIDLSRLPEDMDQPRTVGDLLALLRSAQT